MKSLFIGLLLTFTFSVHAECSFDFDSLRKYEKQILDAADSGKIDQMAKPFQCILRMQMESQGLSNYMAHSFLGPLLGGEITPGLKKDVRYQKVTKALEKLSLKASHNLRNSFVTVFSQGEWKTYSLFCEQGNTSYCSDFMPDVKKIKEEPPLLAAASMLRLKQAYTVLKGPQKDLIASRLKKLFSEIPLNDPVRRKFIEEIHQELFEVQIPLSLS